MMRHALIALIRRTNLRSTFLLLLLPLMSSAPFAPFAVSYHPPGAFQVFWSASDNRLQVDVYPDGGWQLEPNCYDWPSSCWDIIGERWSFHVEKGEAGAWTVVAGSGDGIPAADSMEQALVAATLATLNTGDRGAFAAFEPAFDACYVRLLVAIHQDEPPPSATWPDAGPGSRCPW